MMKAKIAKTVFWLLVGGGITVMVLRLIHGLGSVVALTDILPWGLWKGLGVVALVPIGGAGFTMAALVYIFHWQTVKPLARGAVLLGMMCYLGVVIGLTFDIGISWRIVFPVVFWQFHSTLFEIAWCIMLYLTVLFLEFGHVVLEKYNFPRLLRLVEKCTVLFVIAGISLSTLHQSSLGTLFLATPYRLHPLWYTELLPLFFFLTSIGIGCLTITWVTIAVHWIYAAIPPMKALSALGRLAACFLGTYALIKFGEIAVAGETGFMLEMSRDSFNFWAEMSLSALIPVILLAFKNLRENPKWMFWISTMAIAGILLNRVNVAGLATVSLTGSMYFPMWTEWMITFAILAGAGICYLFAIENFAVFSTIPQDKVKETSALGKIDHADWKTVFFAGPLAEVRLYSAVFVIAVGVTMGLLPERAVFGIEPEPVPVHGPRIIAIIQQKNPQGPGTLFTIPGEPAQSPDTGQRVNVLMIDGNRDGRYVLFDHQSHIRKSGGERSCVLCHHSNKPFEEVSRCHECHRDMYTPTNVFDHDLHAEKMGGNRYCVECHRDLSLPKVKKNVVSCRECHKNMYPAGSLVAPKTQDNHHACGYMDAMHGLCIPCHRREQPKLADPNEDFSRCSNCHRDLPQVGDKEWTTRR